MTTEPDQLIAYALGQLPPAEMARVEAALQATPALRHELQRHLDALEQLLDSLDVQAAQVPEGAEERLLARVRAEEAAEPTRTTAPGLSAAPRPGARTTRTGPPSAAGLRRQWWVPAVLALAAAVTVASVLRIQADPLERYARMPGAVRQEVSTAQGPVGTLVRLPDGRIFVHLDRAPAGGRTYQLWQISAGQPASLGVFGTGGLLTAALPAEVTLAVSVEPAGGSPQPTTQPLFAQKI